MFVQICIVRTLKMAGCALIFREACNIIKLTRSVMTYINTITAIAVIIVIIIVIIKRCSNSNTTEQYQGVPHYCRQQRSLLGCWSAFTVSCWCDLMGPRQNLPVHNTPTQNLPIACHKTKLCRTNPGIRTDIWQRRNVTATLRSSGGSAYHGVFG